MLFQYLRKMEFKLDKGLVCLIRASKSENEINLVHLYQNNRPPADTLHSSKKVLNFFFISLTFRNLGA